MGFDHVYQSRLCSQYLETLDFDWILEDYSENSKLIEIPEKGTDCLQDTLKLLNKSYIASQA